MCVTSRLAGGGVSVYFPLLPCTVNYEAAAEDSSCGMWVEQRSASYNITCKFAKYQKYFINFSSALVTVLRLKQDSNQNPHGDLELDPGPQKRMRTRNTGNTVFKGTRSTIFNR